MSEVIERIGAWESAGLIDGATADRLREAEAGRSDADRSAATVAAADARAVVPAAQPGRSAVGAFVGPSVTIPEVFGYLGTGFLLAAWTAWAERGTFASRDLVPGLASLVAAVLLIALGLVLRRGDARRSRAAGAAFLVAVAYVGVGCLALAGTTSMTPEQAAMVGAGAALAVAFALRAIHPALLTQVGLLAAITGLAGAILVWAQSTFLPNPTYTYDTPSGAAILTPGVDPLVAVVGSAAWWLSCAVLIGLIGLIEARAAERGDEAAAHRAAISRLWAGIVAVVGLATAVSRSDLVVATGEFERVVQPWVGQLSLVVLSLILLERAFRRDATAYVYAAALGLIVALTDFNVTYLSDSTEIGLAIEGAILLGVGLAADRLRRRIGRSRAGDTSRGTVGEPGFAEAQPDP